MLILKSLIKLILKDLKSNNLMASSSTPDTTLTSATRLMVPGGGEWIEGGRYLFIFALINAFITSPLTFDSK